MITRRDKLYAYPVAIAVTADIVGSRRIRDRAAAQRILDQTIARVERELPLAGRPLRPTVGDELQAVYASVEAALASLLLLQLALPDGVECRFGIGIGPIGTIASTAGDIADGPGWWAAREAIDTVHGLEQRAVPHARTWIVVADDADHQAAAAARMSNCYLLTRDQLVGVMSQRARLLTYGRCLGVTQRALARDEGITQSAVSQALANSGARAVVEGFRLLRAATQ